MFGSVTNSSNLVLRHCRLLLPRVSLSPFASMSRNPSPFASYAQSSPSGGRGRASDMRGDRERTRGRGGGAAGKDKIDALVRVDIIVPLNAWEDSWQTVYGKGIRQNIIIETNCEKVGESVRKGKSSREFVIMKGVLRCGTRILRHMASELNLNIRSDGYVKVDDLLKLNLKTFANIPLRSHTIDDIREAVRKDNKQRFSLIEENGELLIRANQGHTVTAVESESLLKPILSAEEILVCVHGTYRRNLESILESGLKRMKRLHVHFSCGLPTDGEVISGMRRDVNVLIYLDVRKALEEGMKLFISDNKVILTEGFDGVVPPKYFQKIESWPNREPIPF